MKWQRTVMITVLCLGLFCSFSTLNNQAMAQGKAAPAAQKITVLNPMGTPPPIQRKAQAPRLDTLDGKTIYLVNTGFVGTERLMEVMTEWFATNYPKTTIVNKRNQWINPTKLSGLRSMKKRMESLSDWVIEVSARLGRFASA
jgi:hypothetical protein